jgi:hypothetical protein
MSDEYIPLRVHSIAQLEAYLVTAEELEAIKREGHGVGFYFHVSEFFLTAGIAFLIALLTTEIKSPRVFNVFVLMVLVGLSLGIVFGIKWYMGRDSVNAIFRRIEERQIGPGGDAGNQLQPAALAQLPPVAPPPAIEIVGNVIPVANVPASNPVAPQEGQ